MVDNIMKEIKNLFKLKEEIKKKKKKRITLQLNMQEIFFRLEKKWPNHKTEGTLTLLFDHEEED